MKAKLSLFIVGVTIPFQVGAEQLEEKKQLPEMTIEGEAPREGSFSVTPNKTGLLDTASMLKRVPGANIARNGPLTGLALYRGQAGYNNLNVTVNGMNLREAGPNAMDTPLSMLSGELTKSLQVLRGIAPVSAGMETLGGAMKAESQKGEFAKGDGVETNGMAYSGYRSVSDGHEVDLLGTVATKHHKLYIGGSSMKGGNYRIKNNQRQVPTQYSKNEFVGGYGYKLDGHELGLNFTNENTGPTGTPALPMDIIYIRGGTANGNYKWDLGKDNQLKVNLFYQNVGHLMNNYTLREKYTNLAMSAYRQNHAVVEAGGWNIAYSMPFYEGKLQFGTDGDLATHNSLITNPNMAAFYVDNFKKAQRDRYSIFSEWNGAIADRWTAEFGARVTAVVTNSGNVATSMAMMPNMMGMAANSLMTAFNSQDHQKNFVGADLASVFRYAINDKSNFEIGLGRKKRFPTYQELYLWLPLQSNAGLADGRNYIGNLNLKPETSYQLELGYAWKGDQFYFAPRAYYHYVLNYIQGLRSTNMSANMISNMQIHYDALQFSNIDAELFGTDIESSYAFNDNWQLNGVLNYVRGRRVNVSGTQNLYRMPPLNGRTWLTYRESKWQATVEGVFYARQGNVATFNKELKTPGYILLNLRGNYEPVDGLTVSAGVQNLLDKKHYNALGGINWVNLARNNNNPAARQRVAMPGRNMYVSLNYKW